MRRAVVAVIVGGYAFWAIGSGLGHQPVTVGARLTAAVKPAQPAGAAQPAQPARPTQAAKAARHATQTVTFGGYTVSVPASWPVYDLTKNPHQCVRYDVHAVYLGTSGPDPDCPPNLVGRVDTVTIQVPAGSAGTQTGGTKTTETQTAGSSKGPRQGGQQALSPGTIVQDPERHELALAMPDKAPSVGATYGTGPDSTEQILATVRQASIRQAAKQQQALSKHASTRKAGPEQAGDSIRSTGHPVVARTAAHVTARNPAWPRAEAITGPGGTLAGFDTCAAPSLPTMKAWRAKYAATAIYIGGQMMACGQGNLSTNWVQQPEAIGYALMPTFVGLQAPCNSFSGKIDPKQAASQGTAAANQAVTPAKSYGLGAGTPIYYDMEAYNHTNAGCRTAVLTFLDAWK